jgi:hypothetical protein
MIFLPSYTQTQLNWRHICTLYKPILGTHSFFSVYSGHHCKCTDTHMLEGFSGLFWMYIHSLGKASSRHPLIYILYSLSRPAYQHQRGSVSLFCVSDSIYLSVCVCYCLSLSVCVSDFISVCLSSVCLSLSVCVSDCIYVCLCVTLFIFASLCDRLYLCMFVCLTVYISVCMSDCLSVCLSDCLSVFVCFWLSFSVCLSVCLTVSLCACMSHCFCLSVW